MTFNFNIQDVLALLSIFTLLLGLFNSYVVKPLKEALYALREQMKDLSKEIAISREDRRNFDKELGRMNESLKAAHKRIDHLESERV